jgi:hypothetical protein
VTKRSKRVEEEEQSPEDWSPLQVFMLCEGMKKLSFFLEDRHETRLGREVREISMEVFKKFGMEQLSNNKRRSD